MIDTIRLRHQAVRLSGNDLVERYRTLGRFAADRFAAVLPDHGVVFPPDLVEEARQSLLTGIAEAHADRNRVLVPALQEVAASAFVGRLAERAVLGILGSGPLQ